MKKIMFSDRFGLTEAVLQGRKTMTRRVIADKDEIDAMVYAQGSVEKKTEYLLGKSRYKIGEVVAVAQSYEYMANGGYLDRMMETSSTFKKEYCSAGWSNKMFVRADLMPHQIRITNIKVERMQDISDEDCLKEGIIPVMWRQYLKQDWNDFSPQKYIDHDVWTLPIFKEGILDSWAESHPDEFMADSPQTAFAVLIFKMMGKKVWDSNPFVFVYTFKLIK